MKKTNVKRHVRRTKKKVVPVRRHSRKVKKNRGMAFTKIKKITTPNYTRYVGIDEMRPGEKSGALSYDWEVKNIKEQAEKEVSGKTGWKDVALGKEKRYSGKDDVFARDMTQEEIDKANKEWQRFGKARYEEGIRVKGLKEIVPTRVVSVSRREISSGGVEEKGASDFSYGVEGRKKIDWDKKLEDKIDIDFVRKLQPLAGARPEDVKVEDVLEFIGLTPDEVHAKAFPPVQIVAPEDKEILLKPAIYNKKGKKGDFQIRGEGPVGTLKEIKDMFPDKKLKIDWGNAVEDIDEEDQS